MHSWPSHKSKWLSHIWQQSETNLDPNERRSIHQAWCPLQLLVHHSWVLPFCQRGPPVDSKECNSVAGLQGICHLYNPAARLWPGSGSTTVSSRALLLCALVVVISHCWIVWIGACCSTTSRVVLPMLWLAASACSHRPLVLLQVDSGCAEVALTRCGFVPEVQEPFHLRTRLSSFGRPALPCQ